MRTWHFCSSSRDCGRRGHLGGQIEDGIGRDLDVDQGVTIGHGAGKRVPSGVDVGERCLGIGGGICARRLLGGGDGRCGQCKNKQTKQSHGILRRCVPDDAQECKSMALSCARTKWGDTNSRMRGNTCRLRGVYTSTVVRNGMNESPESHATALRLRSGPPQRRRSPPHEQRPVRGDLVPVAGDPAAAP